MCIYIPHISHIVSRRFIILLSAVFMIQVLLLRFSLRRLLKKETNSFKMFLNHVTKQQQLTTATKQTMTTKINCRGPCEG